MYINQLTGDVFILTLTGVSCLKSGNESINFLYIFDVLLSGLE